MIPADLLYLLFAMRRSEPKTVNQSLRHDVPTIADAPDRARWEAEHGQKPWPITEEYATERGWNWFERKWLTRMAGRARAIMARDLATIDRAAAIQQQTKMAHVCDRVKYAFDIKHAEVFFDQTDGQFWIYPHGWARNESE